MGKEIAGIPESASLEADRGSIGAYLARQRRLRSISLEELRAATRIPLRSLERLEAGSFDDSPDGFARGFVRTVAVALGLDPNETVNRMLCEPGPVVREPRGLPAPRPSLWVGLGALALVLLGAVVFFSVRSIDERPVAQGSEVQLVTRRDVVRALADSVAGRTPQDATPIGEDRRPSAP